MIPERKVRRFIGFAFLAACIVLPSAIVSVLPTAKAAQRGDIANATGYSRYVAITPSDTTQYGRFATTQSEDIDAIYIGGAGNLAIAGSDGVAVTFTAPPVGTVLTVSPTKIMSTNTTATLILALYR